jgi:hypothetical protein
MFGPPSGGSGDGRAEEDKVLVPFIASLKQEERLDPAPRMTGNIELDLHRKESLALFIWRELEPVVRFYVPRFLWCRCCGRRLEDYWQRLAVRFAHLRRERPPHLVS